MQEKTQQFYEQIDYSMIVPKLETMVDQSNGETAFCYASEGSVCAAALSVDSHCVWRFIVSEADFKAEDVVMGRPFSLDAVQFFVDFVPHKSFHISSFTLRPAPFVVPPHICGILFPTPGGRLMMQDNIQFIDMCNVMLNTDVEQEEKLKDRRAALWALANIAVLSKGVAFIKVRTGRNRHVFRQRAKSTLSTR